MGVAVVVGAWSYNLVGVAVWCIVQDIIKFQNANFASLFKIYKLIDNTIVMVYFKVGDNLD